MAWERSLEVNELGGTPVSFSDDNDNAFGCAAEQALACALGPIDNAVSASFTIGAIHTMSNGTFSDNMRPFLF